MVVIPTQMWYFNNIFQLKNYNWNEESKTIQKSYQNAQYNFRHFLIWSRNRMKKNYIMQNLEALIQVAKLDNFMWVY